jgi:hypothetical protein
VSLSVPGTRICSQLILEETLLDLKEIPGEHSGENLANAIWETLKLYGLCDKVELTLLRPEMI